MKPEEIEQASKERRLCLKRTKGSLSGGTCVTLAPGISNSGDVWNVQARVVVSTRTAPGWRKVEYVVMVTTDDLVIRHKKQHTNSVHQNRRQRRAAAAIARLSRA